MSEKGAKKRVKLSRVGIAIALAAIKGFSDPKVSSEQYMTNTEIAATILWDAYMKGDIEGKVIADLGCGTGILGIGAMMLGATTVYFVESDKVAMDITKENVKATQNMESESSVEFFLGDVALFDERVDTVIMNPPFGVKSEHSDKMFLKKAFEISNVVYSFHKSETKTFIERFVKENKFNINQVMDLEWPLKATMKFHEKKVKKINVSCFRLIKE